MGYCMSQTSLAHTYGNVTCFITEYVKSMFPQDYFKTIHISSTIAYRQFNIFQNKSKEFLKKNKPMLIIRPRIELNDSDVFLYNTFLTTRITDNYMDIDFTNLQEFIYDPETGIYLKYLLNRLKMLFDVTIIVESQIEQLNQAHFFKNRVRQDRPFFLTTSLESYIPRGLLKMVGDEINIPLYDENNSVKTFLDYINNVSIYPVSYKMKNSSGNDEFFRFYPVNIDTTIGGLAIDEGNKKGMVSDAHTITFTISTEFNSAGLYYFFTNNSNINQIEISDKEYDPDKIVPMFTIDNVYQHRIAEGWNVYAAPMYFVDADSTIEDIMDISTIFNNSIRSLITYHLDNGVPMNTFMIIMVTKDNDILVEGKDYEVDYEKLELKTKTLSTFSTYRIIIHVNVLYINTMIKDILELENEK